MPDITDRRRKVRAAAAEVRDQLTRIFEESDLTDIELLSIVTEWQAGFLKDAGRDERGSE